MRISDWSSDVCSSDLVWPNQCAGRGVICTHCQGGKKSAGCPARIRTSIDGVRVRSLTFRRRGINGRVEAGQIIVAVMPVNGGRERKSVVQGKRVSVRVDPVGRSIMKERK